MPKWRAVRSFFDFAMAHITYTLVCILFQMLVSVGERFMFDFMTHHCCDIIAVALKLLKFPVLYVRGLYEYFSNGIMLYACMQIWNDDFKYLHTSVLWARPTCMLTKYCVQQHFSVQSFANSTQTPQCFQSAQSAGAHTQISTALCVPSNPPSTSDDATQLRCHALPLNERVQIVCTTMRPVYMTPHDYNAHLYYCICVY